jgi:hypothetical protein
VNSDYLLVNAKREIPKISNKISLALRITQSGRKGGHRFIECIQSRDPAVPSATQAEFVVMTGGLHPVTESQEFCSETCFHTLSLVKHGFLCGTRPWSAVGRRSELSHHTLDDRHEGGAKSGARGAVRFSRAVPSLLVSALHFRSASGAFAGGCARFDPKFFPPLGGTPGV